MIESIFGRKGGSCYDDVGIRLWLANDAQDVLLEPLLACPAGVSRLGTSSLVRLPPYGNRQSTSPVEPSAIEILRQRYARGEIDATTDATTFEQIRERLEDSREQHPVGSV